MEKIPTNWKSICTEAANDRKYLIDGGLVAILLFVFSWIIFAALTALAVATVGMTWLLSLRWTRHRPYYVLHEFCRSHDLRVVPGMLAAVTAGSVIEKLGPLRFRWLLRGGGVSLLRAQSIERAYNLLVLEIPAAWPASALRPTRMTYCIVDSLELFSYPSTIGVERFTLHGVDPAAARRLNESHARGLLPPDITLVVAGHELVLDFSHRPFDPIEFDRMIALARQLAGSLPTVVSRSMS